MECSKMFNVSTVGHTTHIKPTFQFLPNTFQHCIVNGCNSFRYSGLQLIHVFWKERHIHQSFHKPPQKEIAGCEIWRPGRPEHENAIISPRPSNPSVWQRCVQKLSNSEAPVWWRPILLENEVVRLFLTQVIHQQLFQHVEVRLTIDCCSFEEEWSVDSFLGHGTKHGHLWGISPMLKNFMWVLSSPYTNVTLVNFAIYVEGRLIAINKLVIKSVIFQLLLHCNAKVTTSWFISILQLLD